MAKAIICDGCGNLTSRIAFKLYISFKSAEPVNVRANGDHTTYAKYADIGECCAERMTRIVRWQARKTRHKPGKK